MAAVLAAPGEEVSSRVDTVNHTTWVWRDMSSQVMTGVVTVTRPLALRIIEDFVELALRRASLRQDEDGWFAEIPGFDGVWAKEASPKETLDVLRDVLFEWIVLKINDRDADVPVIGSLDINSL